jgi:hypothetical protein
MQLRTKIALRLVGRDFWHFVGSRERAMEEMIAEIEQAELQQVKCARDLIQNFHDSLEAEVDEETLINGLEIALVDLNDHVARLEEFSSTSPS